jgi:hypothetical protein
VDLIRGSESRPGCWDDALGMQGYASCDWPSYRRFRGLFFSAATKLKRTTTHRLHGNKCLSRVFTGFILPALRAIAFGACKATGIAMRSLDLDMLTPSFGSNPDGTQYLVSAYGYLMAEMAVSEDKPLQVCGRSGGP